jgi:hypothetical protein
MAIWPTRASARKSTPTMSAPSKSGWVYGVTAQFDGSASMGALANRQGARNRAESGRETGKQPPEPAIDSNQRHPHNLEAVKADLP